MLKSVKPFAVFIGVMGFNKIINRALIKLFFINENVLGRCMAVTLNFMSIRQMMLFV